MNERRTAMRKENGKVRKKKKKRKREIKPVTTAMRRVISQGRGWRKRNRPQGNRPQGNRLDACGETERGQPAGGNRWGVTPSAGSQV